MRNRNYLLIFDFPRSIERSFNFACPQFKFLIVQIISQEFLHNKWCFGIKIFAVNTKNTDRNGILLKIDEFLALRWEMVWLIHLNTTKWRKLMGNGSDIGVIGAMKPKLAIYWYFIGNLPSIAIWQRLILRSGCLCVATKWS